MAVEAVPKQFSNRDCLISALECLLPSCRLVNRVNRAYIGHLSCLLAIFRIKIGSKVVFRPNWHISSPT